MTCEHCCGANKIFDQKNAQKEKRKYLKNGPRKTTKKLLAQIDSLHEQIESVTDIGAGIGAIHLHFLDNGAHSATDVDASASYMEQSKELAASKGHAEKIRYCNGDFLDFHSDIGKSDLVALEKVVCCYPFMEELLDKAAGKGKKVLALVYPMSNVFSKAFVRLGNLWFWLKGNPFRTYIHDNSHIQSVLIKAGYKRAVAAISFPWRIETYVRI